MEKKCNINTASPEELHDICDAEPSTAESIVKARADEPFKSIDDIVRVPGIGGTTVERMKSNGCYAE